MIKLLLLSFILLSCTGEEGGAGGDNSAPVPSEKVEVTSQNFISNNGDVTVSIPQAEIVKKVEVFEDNRCSNKVSEIPEEEVETPTTINLKTSREGTRPFYGVVELKDGRKIPCREIFTYTFDVTPPEVSSEPVAGIQNLDNSSTSEGISIQGNSEDISDESVKEIVLYSDSEKTNVIGTMTKEEYLSGKSFDVPESLENSTFDVYMSYVDIAGNESGVNGDPISITHDDTPPVAPSFDGPSLALDGTNSNSTTDYAIGFNIDNTDTQSVEVIVNGVVVETIDEISGTSYGSTFSIPENQESVISVVTVDNLGNRNETTSFTINHDNIAPTDPTVLIPSGGNSANPTVVVNHAEETEGIFRLYSDDTCSTEISLDNNSLSDNSLSTQLGSGASLTVEATYNYYAELTDPSNNTGNCISVGSYIYDVTPPLLSTTYVQGGNGYGNNSPSSDLELAGDCEGSLDISVTVGGTPGTTLTCSGGVYTGVVYDLSTLSEGDHVVLVSSSDQYGNSSSTTRTITKDTTAPPVVGFDAATELKITNGLTKDECTGNPCLQVIADNLDPDISEVSVYSDEAQTALVTKLSDDDLSSGTFFELNANSLNTVYLVSVDDFGNKSTARTLNITHDNVPPAEPTLGASSVAASGQTTAQYILPFDAVCAGDTTHYRLYDSSDNEIETLSVADYTAQGSHFNLTVVPDTSNMFSATCLDLAQNESTAVTFSFTHNIIVPTIVGTITVVPDTLLSATIVGGTNIVINPGTSGSITFPTGSSFPGFDIVNHTFRNLPPGLSNCAGLGVLNAANFTCDYDYTGESAPLSESATYYATDEWNAESSDTTYTIQLNEGPQF